MIPAARTVMASDRSRRIADHRWFASAFVVGFDLLSADQESVVDSPKLRASVAVRGFPDLAVAPPLKFESEGVTYGLVADAAEPDGWRIATKAEVDEACCAKAGGRKL